MKLLFKEADYTRVSDDASVLCLRQDFPRAVRLLQQRSPDHRRWRRAFRGVTIHADRTLDGSRRDWMSGAVKDLVFNVVSHPWLRNELALDLHGSPGFAIDDVLPEWTAREVWSLAETEGLPMSYIATVTSLPRAIDQLVNTARLVTDFRRTAVAHRSCARDLTNKDALGLRNEIHAQTDAAERWRGLARRLLLTPPRAE